MCSKIVGAGILRRVGNHGYSSPENDTWVYKVVADSSCRKNRYQPIRHAAAAGGRAPGHVWGQYIQLQHTPADPEEEASLAPLSRAGLGPEGRSVGAASQPWILRAKLKRWKNYRLLQGRKRE